MEESGTLNTRHLLPLSGYEFEFSLEPWSESEMSANCYSYAVGHFKLGLSIKTQPGDVARLYDDLRRNYSLNSNALWRDCVDIKKRIHADGIATWRLLGFKGSGATMFPMSAEERAPPGYYKIMSVTDGVTGGPDEMTDYHLIRQDSANLRTLYTLPMYNYIDNSAFRVDKNPYEVLGLDPFVSGNHLEDIATGSLSERPEFDLISGFKDVGNVPARLVRSFTNVNIHVGRLPSYVIEEGNFIPDPFWIVGANPFNPDSDTIVARRERELLQLFAGRELHCKTIMQAALDCRRIRENPSLMPKKNMLIGLWSHKLGWASGPINSDGNSKLIFDPRRARKQHGDLHYTNNCSSFAVMRGQGLAAVPSV